MGLTLQWPSPPKARPRPFPGDGYKRATERQGPGTAYTFAVGGTAPMPEFVKYRMDELVAGVKYDPAHVKEGTILYVSNCVFCHSVPGVDRAGNIPNLAYMNAAYMWPLTQLAETDEEQTASHYSRPSRSRATQAGETFAGSGGADLLKIAGRLIVATSGGSRFGRADDV